MPRTPVVSKDIITAIVTAINGTTVNGGTLTAVATPGGQSIKITPHSDALAPASTLAPTYELYLH